MVPSKVADDEGAQQKAFNYAWERMRLRGTSESETSHPAWNSFKKAISKSNLTVAMMKLTLCCPLSAVQGFSVHTNTPVK